MKNASSSSIRKTLLDLHNCVERNLRHIDKILEVIGGREFHLGYRHQRQLWIIRTLYEQLRRMYEERSRCCPDRIVSISQPHVPHCLGQTGKKVEFGSKLSLSAFVAKSGVTF